MHDSIRRLLDNVLESDIRDRSSVTVEKRRESAESTAYTIRVENLAANTESFNSNSPHVDIDYVQSASPGLNVEPAIVRIGVRSIEDQTMVEQKIQVLTYPVDEAPDDVNVSQAQAPMITSSEPFVSRWISRLMDFNPP